MDNKNKFLDNLLQDCKLGTFDNNKVGFYVVDKAWPKHLAQQVARCCIAPVDKAIKACSVGDDSGHLSFTEQKRKKVLESVRESICQMFEVK